MRQDDFNSFQAVPITKGFPDPWKRNLLDTYKQLIEEGVFYPGLHGYTHFNPNLLLQGWHDKGDFGERVRALVEEDITYLASSLPEMNFALFNRTNDRFMSAEEQKDWCRKGVKLFNEAFGFSPLTTVQHLISTFNQGSRVAHSQSEPLAVHPSTYTRNESRL